MLVANRRKMAALIMQANSWHQMKETNSWNHLKNKKKRCPTGKNTPPNHSNLANRLLSAATNTVKAINAQKQN